MLNLAKRPDGDRAAIFTTTAIKIGLNEAIIEKDFWVCWMLEILFHHSDYSKFLSFKGGTSLSKAYGLINRFSEDIDLILDWRVVGYGTNEPWIERSNTAQDKFNLEINNRVSEFIREKLKYNLENIVVEQGVENCRFYIEESDPQTIRFIYPQIYKDDALLQEIRLEIGCLAAWTPITDKEILPFVSQYFPDVFSIPKTNIRTVEAKRTFWEKATILHSEAYRGEAKIPQRYSRHYYDLYMLYKSFVKEESLSDFELLEKSCNI